MREGGLMQVRIEVEVNDALAEACQAVGADPNALVAPVAVWFSGSSYSDVTIEFDVEG
jgi:hypothetical protein